MLCVAGLKLLLTALVPASYDMRDMAAAIVYQQTNLGPWLTLEAYFFELWRLANQGNPNLGWWATPPTSMTMNIGFLLVLFRLPTFLADVATTVLIYLAVSRFAAVREARLATILWFLNPYATLAIELVGVPDIVPALLTLVAAVSVQFRKSILAALSLAAAIAIKLYAILLVPPLLLYSNEVGERARSRIMITAIAIAGLIGYWSWLFPDGNYSIKAFTDYSAVTQPMPALFQWAPTTYINAAIVALFAVYFGIWELAKGCSITDTMLPVLLAYLTFSNPYPQFFLWVLPLLTLDAVRTKNRIPLLVIFCVLILTAWFMTSGGFLTPSGYSLLSIRLEGSKLPWYSQSIQSFLKSNLAILVTPLVFSTLRGVTLIYTFEIARGWFTPIRSAK